MNTITISFTEDMMKQTKKLTRNQRELLEKRFGVKNTNVYRLVEETNDFITVQNVQRGNIKRFDK